MSMDMSGTISHFEVVIYHELHLGPLDISISNTAVYTWLAVVIVILGLRLSFLKPKIIPDYAQLMVESLYAFIARQTEGNIQGEGKNYIPLMSLSLHLF